MENEMPVPPFRGAIFGLNKYGVQCVHGPKEAEDCGLYIHVDDLEKYEQWQKDQEAPASTRESK